MKQQQRALKGRRFSASATSAKRETESSAVSSKQRFSEIISATQSTRKRKSLTNVWKALEHLRAVKSSEFTVASVARAIEALHLAGPKAQSIRNAEGHDFREIIVAYAREFGDPKSQKPEDPEFDHILSAIPDLRTAAFVRELMCESRSKDRRISLLKNLISKLTPVELKADGSFAPIPGKGFPQASSPQSFSPTDIAAAASFRRSIEDSGEELGLQFEQSSGALLWKDGVLEVARPGFLHLLSRIAGTES